MKKLTLNFYPFATQTIHPFNIHGFSRSETPGMMVEISYDGVTGYGEGALPPYMKGQTVDTATDFLKKVDLTRFSNPFCLDEILGYVDAIGEGMSCPKCAVDIAMHDLVGKLLGRPLYDIWGYNKDNTPDISFTIGMDGDEVLRRKVKEAEPYKLLKVKLGAGEQEDKSIIETIRAVTDKPIVVDANQGWNDRSLALDMISWLSTRNVLFVEQPMDKSIVDDMAWVTERSPLPTFADESCQRLVDVPRLHGVFSGINIKLIKATGLREAGKMITVARGLGMKVMIGCTTETSCALSAAAQLSPKVDFADLDGNLLIANDIFDGMKIVDGRVTLNERPGIGVIKL